MDSAEDSTIEATFRRLFVGCTALVVEDDAGLAADLCAKMKRAGFARVDLAGTGAGYLRATAELHYDIMVIDRQLPDGDGIALLRQVRGRAGPSQHSPALFLTALGAEIDRIEGLAAGGDDYAVKPVSDLEFAARLAALLRRRQWDNRRSPGEARIVSGPLIIETEQRVASLCGTLLDLTEREFDVLTLLARNAGLPVTRSMLWSQCWSSYNFMPSTSTNTMSVLVSRLRRKLEAADHCLAPEHKPLIVSVRDRGVLIRNLDEAR